MIGKRIRLARKVAGLSQRALGSRVGLSHVTIKKYEDDITIPSEQALIELSRALKVRTAYFFRPDMGPIVLEDIKFRKRGALPKRRLDAITHEVIEQMGRRIEIESFFPDPPIRDFAPPPGIPESITEMNQIEDVAVCVREEWNLGMGPIPRLAYVLETNGLHVFVTDAGAQSRFDGLAARANGMPIAVVGLDWPGDRQRFTLAHELGHFMLHGRLAGGVDEEMACNRFAGAFLLPRVAALQKFGETRISIEFVELERLKHDFGLSMSGILRRALDLGIISRAYYAEESDFMRSAGWHLKEPGRSYPREEPRMLEQLVFHALCQEYIGMSKASGLLDVSASEFADILSMSAGNDAVGL